MFKTMDQQKAREFIEQSEDVLTPEVKAEEALYRNTQCPLCGEAGCEKRVQPAKVVPDPDTGEPLIAQSPFGDDMLAKGYAHCKNCNTDFNPKTGMVLSTEASMIHAPPGVILPE